jgi:diguanylate cyclase (GGDEF)-like protein
LNVPGISREISRDKSEDLAAQNRLLTQRLQELMNEGRHNERKMRRFQALELRLVGLNSLVELLRAIVNQEDHGGWDAVSLLLFDPEYEIRRALMDEGVRLETMPQLIFVSSVDEMTDMHAASLFPLLGPYRADRHSRIFQHGRRPSSIALLPLVRYGRLIGSLNIGSFESARFVRGVRTDFLEHFAAVVAICIENAINMERIKRQGLTDTLTAINNRRFFDQRLKEEVEMVGRTGRPLSCMLLDVDFFKRVNDTYGHQVGDQVLREVAALIRAQLRGSDVLSRYGGEEFAALLANTSNEGTLDVAERVRQAIESHVFDSEGFAPFTVTISIGIATFRTLPNTPMPRSQGEVLIGQVDRVLYEAKAGGRNRVVSAGEFGLPPPEAENSVAP